MDFPSDAMQIAAMGKFSTSGFTKCACPVATARVMPAITNVIFAATVKLLRRLPVDPDFLRQV